METTTKKEIASKAREKIAPITEKEDAATKAAVENIAVITTLITIGAYVVMYAYKSGYYSEFNIPAICVRISLKDYLPLLFQICSLSIYIHSLVHCYYKKRYSPTANKDKWVPNLVWLSAGLYGSVFK